MMEKQRKSEELANFMMKNRVFGGVHFFPSDSVRSILKLTYDIGLSFFWR